MAPTPVPRPWSRLARSRLARLHRVPPFILLWLVPVWAAIGLASLAIAWVPIRRLSRSFGVPLGPIGFVPLTSEAQQDRAAHIGHTVRIAAQYAPFRADCFPTAIVAQALCRLYRIPCALHLGARPPSCASSRDGDTPFDAHAWVVSGRVSVAGGRDNFRTYAPLGCWAGRLR